MSSYKVGKIVKGTITGIQKYGIFVDLDDYYSGLIHISEISNEYIENINDFVKIGDTIYAKVLEIDENAFQMKLSIKNINYKENGKKLNKPLKEAGLGFKPLKDKLDIWISEKMSEIDN